MLVGDGYMHGTAQQMQGNIFEHNRRSTVRERKQRKKIMEAEKRKKELEELRHTIRMKMLRKHNLGRLLTEFEKRDVDNSGELSLAEFLKLIKTLRIVIKDESLVAELWNSFPLTDGHMDADELIDWVEDATFDNDKDMERERRMAIRKTNKNFRTYGNIKERNELKVALESAECGVEVAEFCRSAAEEALGWEDRPLWQSHPIASLPDGPVSLVDIPMEEKRWWKNAEENFVPIEDIGQPLSPLAKYTAAEEAKKLSTTKKPLRICIYKITIEKSRVGFGIGEVPDWSKENAPEGVVVTQIMKGSEASQSWMLREGHLLLSINETSVMGSTKEDIVVKLRNTKRPMLLSFADPILLAEQRKAEEAARLQRIEEEYLQASKMLRKKLKKKLKKGKLRKLFASRDKDNSGSISPKELKSLFKKLGLTRPRGEAFRKLWFSLDPNMDGSITWEELEDFVTEN